MNVDVVVDAGNTFIKWGRCSAGKVVEIAFLSPSDQSARETQLRKWGLNERPGSWVVAGSDPGRRDDVAAWLTDHRQRAQILTSHTQLPITVRVLYPEKVGLDRLFDAIAVASRKPPGSAAIAIDAGTAVTIDYVDERNVFQGGVIMPGLALMAAALHQHTAALPLIAPKDLYQWIASLKAAVNPGPPGKSTVEAMSHGVVHAFVGGIERVVRRYQAIAAAPVEIFVGGGDSEPLMTLLAGTVPAIRWPEMTLEGIRSAGEVISAG